MNQNESEVGNEDGPGKNRNDRDSRAAAPETGPDTPPETPQAPEAPAAPRQLADVETDERARLDLLRRIRTQARVEGGQVGLPRDVLAEALSAGLGALVDEEWYLGRYADVADAVARGVLASGRAHYLQTGIYEGRMPYRVRLDNADYLKNYPDVLASIREGAFRSALDHFVQVGFGEGRSFRLASRDGADP